VVARDFCLVNEYGAGNRTFFEVYRRKTADGECQPASG
jgi:hypothetical protein